VITSVRNRQVVTAARLKKRGIREQHRRFLVEGAQATAEALDAGAAETLFHVPGATGRIEALVARAGELGVRVTAVSDDVLTHLTSTMTPQPIAAVARFVDVPLDRVPAEGIVPILSSVRDPGNAGTILRSADAAGASGIVFTEASVDVYNPKTVRASAGSLFHLPLVRDASVDVTVETLRARGFQVLAAAADGERAIDEVDLRRPTAVVFGNEAWGLPPEVRALADASVRVPIRGRAESLNLAAAAALILFEAARRRDGTSASIIARAAHDLRRPLTGLKGFTATLADRWDQLDEDRRREAVLMLSLDAERAGALVELVVALSRAESGRTTRPDVAEVGDAARWLATVYARMAGLPEVRAQGTASTHLDPRLVRAILVSAADALSREGDGPIELRISTAADGALVLGSRAGAARISADTDPSDAVSTLDLARIVVERLGGELETPSEGGFRIRFPAPPRDA